ncbi:MAG: 2-oxo acid dehydrogenase subunit E2 [Marinilabiliales bacterium]|nr:MAG: 2-oxo acid dehydrogenase subunit E2 [Marinilabiliales bacterium]
MATSVVMPRQGQSVESCIITRWHKNKGDTVVAGDILFSYETDKAAFEEEAKTGGILLDIFFEAGDEVPVLETVAVIGEAGEDYGGLAPGGASLKDDDRQPEPGDSHAKDDDRQPETGDSHAKDDDRQPGPDNKGDAGSADGAPEETAEGDTVKSEPAEKVSAKGAEATVAAGAVPGTGRIRISPLARKLAGELGVPPENLHGTGPGGRIIGRDVKRAAAESEKRAPSPGKSSANVQEIPSAGSQAAPDFAAAPGAGPSHAEAGGSGYRDVKLSNMRRIIAGRMEQSLQNSAQLTHHMSADARKMLAWRKEIKQNRDGSATGDITINDMVCFAVVRALKKHPYMNAHYLGDKIRVFNKVHLGIAVDTERGLMVPAVRDAGDMNVGKLAGRIRELAGECRKGSVDPGLLASESATFTVTNLGAYGVEMFTPVLNLPQAGILGVNTITYRPADIGEGVIGFIPVIGLSLTYDHRAVDGAPASAFLAEVRKEIETIEKCTI